MANKKVKENEAVVSEVSGAEAVQNEEPKVQFELVIKVFENGMMQVSSADESEPLQNDQIEGITKTVYEQFRDNRIIQTTLDAFKARLG